MRINVYAEELTTETELVKKVVTDGEFGTRTFYGVKMVLKSPPELHHSAEDDDRSGITFWIKADAHGTITDSATLHDVLIGLLGRHNEAIARKAGESE